MAQNTANCVKWNWSPAAAGYVKLPLLYIIFPVTRKKYARMEENR